MYSSLNRLFTWALTLASLGFGHTCFRSSFDSLQFGRQSFLSALCLVGVALVAHIHPLHRLLLDGHVRVPGPIHLPHPARAGEGGHVVVPEPGTDVQGHKL